ncbi:hypothetical protein ABMC89_15790 [Sulfitobacter sp. HNIBRBA3233]|uniref:hypothetical protein n=1 Tax=Sulfitobacter marinivivus TaxID=3158558 RepID=UPI0032DFAA3A
MTFPEWTKPFLFGAAVGAIAISIVGFSWGGWITSGTAQTRAADMATEEVTLAMVPVCVDASATDPRRMGKLAVLQDLSGYERRNAMMDTGWATHPGTDKPDRFLAEACLAELDLDGS